MSDNKIRAAVFLLCSVLGFCAVGCGKKNVPSENKRLTVAVIPKGTIHEFWKTVHAGAEMAGQEMAADVLWKGSLKEDDREAQISASRLSSGICVVNKFPEESIRVRP